MARPAAFTSEDIVEAAVRLAAGGGAQAVSMVAVARAVGAPSGSLYHRFSGRPELLARVWLAALASFEEAWWKVAASAPDPGVVAAAPVRWARKEPDLARVLAAHRRVDFVGGEAEGEVRAHEARLHERLATLSTRFLGDAGAESLARTRFALATVPLAAIRDGGSEAWVAACARALLQRNP